MTMMLILITNDDEGDGDHYPFNTNTGIVGKKKERRGKQKDVPGEFIWYLGG
jgi:hypothetical protein